MPYIDAARRDAILEELGIPHDSEHRVRPTHRPIPRFLHPGELNFAITALLHEYVLEHTPRSYGRLSEAHSQATLAAAEFYRTVVVPYEDNKHAENGPVSGLDAWLP